ncbi:MAG TPA: hypothetical protein VGB07_37285 [Blastocatellia bacterium]
MREQIANFLNQHTSIIGILLALLGVWELWNGLFRYDIYKLSIEKLIRRRPWVAILGLREPQPRPIQISAALLVLAIGLAMIDFEIGLLPRKLWLGPMTLSLLAFFVILLSVKLKSWRKSRSS